MLWESNVFLANISQKNILNANPKRKWIPHKQREGIDPNILIYYYIMF